MRPVDRSTELARRKHQDPVAPGLRRRTPFRSRRGSRAALLALTVAANALVTIAAAPPAHAYPCLGQTYGSRWDGFGAFNATDNTGNTFEGINGYIENNDMSNCASTDYAAYNFVTTWVMMAGNALTYYAQAGFFRYQGECIYAFSEFWGTDGTYHRDIDTASGCRTGTGAYFQVDYNPTTAKEQMFIGSLLIHATPYDPYVYFHRPWVPQMSGESKYPASVLPGTPANPTEFGHNVLQRFNDSWQTESDTFPNVSLLCNGVVRYKHNSWASHGFYIWTDGDDYNVANPC
jgi:hypothetical protein